MARGEPGRAAQLISLATGEPTPPHVVPVGGLILEAPANGFSGYGQMATALAKEIERAGYPVTWRTIGPRDPSYLPVDPWVDARIVVGAMSGPGGYQDGGYGGDYGGYGGYQPAPAPTPVPTLPTTGPRLVMSPPDQPRDYTDSVLLTMWETTRLRPAWVACLNRAKAIIVPCAWNAEGFRASGVTVPIRVVPLGIDPAMYRPAPSSATQPSPQPAHARRVVRFGAAGRTAHGGARKGLTEVVAAFLDAFPAGRYPDVRLDVKLWPDCQLSDPGDSRVALIRDPFSEAELVHWYRSLDVFVSASKAEGWGLIPHQIGACGVPTIAAIYGGHAAYMSPATTWPVEFDERPIPAGFPIYATAGAHWCIPRHDSLVRRMREAHADPVGRLMKGRASVRRFSQLTWEASGRALVAVLKEFGLVADKPPKVDDKLRLAMKADLCEFGSGSCGCGATARDCSRPDKPAKVWRRDCLECVAQEGPGSPVAGLARTAGKLTVKPRTMPRAKPQASASLAAPAVPSLTRSRARARTRTRTRAPLAIVLSLAARPHYAAQAIDALRACHGIADALILPHVEPIPGAIDAMRAVVDGIDFAECRPTWNATTLGPHRNIRAAWRDGFARADYVLLVEEDVALAADGLDYHRWAAERYRGDAGVFSVTGYHRRGEPCPPALHHVVHRRRWFHPWAAGMWRDRWAIVDGLPEDGGSEGWDREIFRAIVDGRGMSEVYPELARGQNFGLNTSLWDATIMTPEWYRMNHLLKHWGGDGVVVAPGDWREVDEATQDEATQDEATQDEATQQDDAPRFAHSGTNPSG